MELVLDARMVEGFVILSSSTNSFFLTSSFSTMASITRSASLRSCTVETHLIRLMESSHAAWRPSESPNFVKEKFESSFFHRGTWPRFGKGASGGQRSHLGELALGGEAAERGGDGGDGAGEGGGVGVEEEDGAAGGGGELGDPRAHLPRADHAHRRDLTRCRHGAVFGSFRVPTTTLQSSANQEAKTLSVTSRAFLLACQLMWLSFFDGKNTHKCSQTVFSFQILPQTISISMAMYNTHKGTQVGLSAIPVLIVSLLHKPPCS
jgi:hypothetical protein